VDSARRAVLLAVLLLAAVALAADQEPTVIRVSDAVGDTIDRSERDTFHLFPNSVGFQHAVIVERRGPEIRAEVTLAGNDTVWEVDFRLAPTQLERIRFLVDNRDFVAKEVASDAGAAQSLAAFWRSIEEQPPGEPAVPGTTENRYDYALHGATLGSVAGGCLGSHAGITYSYTDEPKECCLPAVAHYRVNSAVFWGASCGITAIGTAAGYALGDRLDRKQTVTMSELKESTNWRTGLALGALVPGVVLGFTVFWLTASSRYGVLADWFAQIDNDPDNWTALPMAFTGLCITVEAATIGYRIGRAMDRRKAEDAEMRRRALGRQAQP